MIRPLISEKSMSQAAHGTYSFILHETMSKTSIAQLIKKLFKVDVVSVNTKHRLGKQKRTGKIFGNRKARTIAMVRLAKNQKIDGFDFPVTDEKVEATKEPKKAIAKDDKKKEATK